MSARDEQQRAGEDHGVDPSGAEVLRLRTAEGPAGRGHALLIGCPLAALGGVARCLAAMEAWLVRNGHARVGERVPSTRQAITAQMGRLLDDVRPGDRVLVYYAGHGHQALPEACVHDQPVAMILPMDAREPVPEGSNVITGHQLVAWLQALARACGADPRGAFAGAGGADGPRPSVTIVLECCHAAGLLAAWPESEVARRGIERKAALALAGVDRGGDGPEPGMLWVLATERSEVAQGPGSNDVGNLTHALVEVLAEHPGEPWWAAMDRVRSTWTDPTQSPGLVGAESMIPLTGERLARPEDFLPCMRDEGAAAWRVPLGDALGWRAGQSVMLTSSLAAPGSIGGTLAQGPKGLEVRTEAGSSGALASKRFAWAWRRSAASTAIVEVWGGHAILRMDVASALEGAVAEVRDLGSGLRAAPEEGCVGLEVSAHEVVVRDRWADAVARTTLEGSATWLRWIDHLAAIEDWLAAGRAAQGWPAGAFVLHWGPLGACGAREAWPEGGPAPRAGTAVWIEIEAATACIPAYVGVFRIDAGREVQALTRHVPGGLPLTERYPLTTLAGKQAVCLEWPGCEGDERTEQLVVMVSDCPLPFTTMTRAGAPGEVGWDSDRVDHRRRARVWMHTVPYRLGRRASR